MNRPASLYPAADLAAAARAPVPDLTPEAVVAVFATAMTDRDVDAAVACFSREACFITPDSTTIRGRDSIRAVLAQLLATCLRVEVEHPTMLVAGGVAMGSQRWTVSFKHSGSESFVRRSSSRMILGEVEGEWKLLIAIPWCD